MHQEHCLQKLHVTPDGRGMELESLGQGRIVQQARGLRCQQPQQARNPIELQRVGHIAQVPIQGGVEVVPEPPVATTALAMQSLRVATDSRCIHECRPADGRAIQ